MAKNVIKNELKYSKRSDHVTDDVMSHVVTKKIIRWNITFLQIFSAV